MAFSFASAMAVSFLAAKTAISWSCCAFATAFSLFHHVHPFIFSRFLSQPSINHIWLDVLLPLHLPGLVSGQKLTIREIA